MILATALETVLRPILATAGPPLVLVGAALLARRHRRLRGARWPLGLGLALGFVASQWGIAGRPTWPPREVLHWLPPAALAAAALGALDEAAGRALLLRVTGAVLRSGRETLRLVLHAALFGGVAWLSLAPLLRRGTPSEAILALLPAVLLAVLAWAGWDRPDVALDPFGLTAALAAALALSAVAVVSGSAKVGQLAGAVAAGATPLLLASLRGARATWARGPSVVATALLLGLALQARHYVEADGIACSLIALTALSAWWGRLPRARRLAGARAWIAAAVLAGIPAAAAVARAWSASEPDPYAY